MRESTFFDDREGRGLTDLTRWNVFKVRTRSACQRSGQSPPQKLACRATPRRFTIQSEPGERRLIVDGADRLDIAIVCLGHHVLPDVHARLADSGTSHCGLFP